MDTITIIQWNCRSAIANKENLEFLLESNNTDIALLSETWFKPGQYVKFSSFNTLRADRADGHGGVAILIKNNIKYKETNMPVFANISYKSVEILVDNRTKITLVSLYIKPQTKITVDAWRNFFSTISKPFIIGGDFNAHHFAWGCSYVDTYGNNLLEALDANNLVYLNDGTATLLRNLNQQPSAIDLTLCSADMQHLLDWSTMEEPHGSDHLPILIQCHLKPEPNVAQTVRKWKIIKANWNQYHENCEEIFQNDDEISYIRLIEKIEEASRTSIPQYSSNKPPAKSKGKFWWNEHCDEAVRKRKQSYQLYKNNPNLENLLAYKKQDANTKKFIKNTKRQSWRNFCRNLNKNTPIKTVWHNLNKYKNRRQQNYIMIDPESEWIKDFHTKLAPPSVPEVMLSTPEVIPAVPEQSSPDPEATEEQLKKEVGLILYEDRNDRSLTSSFTIHELNVALRYNKNTAPGKDQIHYSMLYYLPQQVKHLLLNVINRIWSNVSPVPSSWLDYIIVPMLKTGKPPDNPDSYRPIALASCFLKIYERMIKNRLEFWLERNHLLPVTQFGFRKGYSTQESIAALVTDIQISFSRNESVAALFIDIHGAYDNVNLNILSCRMKEIGIPNIIVENIYRLYSKRNIYIRTSSSLIGPRQTFTGIPQGSILSPLLYILYTHSFEKMFPHKIKTLQFADDICVYTTHGNINQCYEELQNSMGNLTSWLHNSGFIISELKSSICTFTRKRMIPPDLVQLGNYQFPYKTKVKFLGIYLDTKLSWKHHINYLCGRGEKAINILRALNGTSWGADPNISLLFYRSLIRSILDYGSIFYGNAAKCHLQKIELLKNKCLRLCGGYLRSTPTVVMEVEVNEPPLKLRRNLLSEKFLLKLQSKNSMVVQKIQELLRLAVTSRYWTHKNVPLVVANYERVGMLSNDIHRSNNLNIFSANYEIFGNIPCITIGSFDKDQPQERYKSSFLADLSKKWADFEHIYTDGSILNGRTGCAFYHHNSVYSKLFRLKPNSSVYTAELVAIREAIKYCLTINKEKFVIFTDSKSSLEKIKSATVMTNLNYLIIDILKDYNKLNQQGKQLSLVWVKGHFGIQYNEMVDQLAKKATIQGDTLEEFKIPSVDLHRLLNADMKIIWQNIYNNSDKGQTYKSIQPNIPLEPWFHSESNRSLIKVMNRVRSNHALTPQYKYKIGIAEEPYCSCGEVGDLQHYLLECSQNNQHIELLFTQLGTIGVTQPINLNYLLALKRIDVFRILYNYVKKTQIQI